MVDNGWVGGLGAVLSGRFQGKAQQGAFPVRVSDDGTQVIVDRYAELALRGQVFIATRAAVTIPVNAATLVSVFSLVNPTGSGVLLDVFEVSAHAVVATTVVDALGVYYQANAYTTATLTTQDTADVQNARLGEGSAPAGRLYSALTHAGTPILAGLVGGWGAVTDGGSTEISRQFNGKLLVPPGAIISLAMTTAASTASGITAEVKWAEIPYTAI